MPTLTIDRSKGNLGVTLAGSPAKIEALLGDGLMALASFQVGDALLAVNNGSAVAAQGSPCLQRSTQSSADLVAVRVVAHSQRACA